MMRWCHWLMLAARNSSAGTWHPRDRSWQIELPCCPNLSPSYQSETDMVEEREYRQKTEEGSKKKKDGRFLLFLVFPIPKISLAPSSIRTVSRAVVVVGACAMQGSSLARKPFAVQQTWAIRVRFPYSRRKPLGRSTCELPTSGHKLELGRPRPRSQQAR
ncbi:hypothetical protein GGR56DRAFT_234018 [Xylariaceae sp. FL0804]|nr:hypothetical protein GGR56DRAFT_234018 [Xylariaceae sp. FL0804]